MNGKILLGAAAVIVLVGVAVFFFLNTTPQAGPRAGTACPDPLVVAAPVDVTQATSVLYPGQTRGGDFKGHGGFRFDNAVGNSINITAPLDATLSAASRYIEQGEVQYLLDFQTPCGVRYRFDHLRTLAPKFATAMEKLPPAQPDDSRTTNISEEILVAQGETIATAVGFTNNVSVDFGVYQADTPLCWLDLLPAAQSTQVKSLPAGDHQAGKQSEYCH